MTTDALTAAQERVRAIEADPLAAAAKQIEHEVAMRNAYAMIRALVAAAGGSSTITAAELADPRQRLIVEPQADASVVLRTVERD